MRPHLLALAVCAIAAVASLAAAQESDADLLLALPDACYENWDNATAGLAGAPWVEGTPPCGGGTAQPWRGVTCNAQGQVVKLAVTGGRLRCTHLPGELAHLPALQFLDLKCNALNSSVPAEWRAAGSFPVLQTLNLADNLLTGALSDYTKADGGPLASVVFNVSRNLLSDSPLPASWHSSTLKVMDVSYNRVPGSLPAQWAAPVAGQRSAFPQLHTLMVQGNTLEGAYPYGNGSAFASNFSITARPGNGMLEGAPAAAPAAGTSSSSSSGLSGGAIAGIVVGCVAAAALAAVLAAYVLRRRRQRSVSGGAASTAADASAAGKLGWDKDVESGPGSNSPPGGSAWGSLGSAPPPTGEAASLRDSAMGSRATASSSPGGEGSGHGMSIGGSGVREGSGATQLSEGSAGDTDVRRLPGGWATIDFSELELSTVLGQGSFGCVRLAKWCQTTVAVKMLTLGSSQAGGAEEEEQQAKLLRQLEKEAAVMSKLHHPNVCHLLAITRQPACLVMEYASRRSVDKLLVAGHKDSKVAKQLSWPRLLGMALDAARGMLYLHSRDVCHRDLKSANLLVTAAWQVKVADFNLSRGAESQGLSTVVVQNPRWLAPERLAGGAGGLPSDVWAFGTVLWELLTWRHPHDDQNAYQIIHTVQAAASGSGLAVPPPDALPAGPLAQYGEYVALMEACWARDPAQRPTMEAVATRLRNILAAEVGRPLTGSTASEMPSPQVSGPVELAPGLAAQAAVASGSQAALGSSAGRNSGSGASPFEAAPFAAAPVRQPSDAAAASPFAAAPVRQPSNAAAASPFAAAPVRQPSDAAGASPFAAAAPKRQPSMGPSPFAAAPAQQPGSAADASPFAAAGMARQPSTAAGPSPFAAAANMARQPSTAPQSPPNGTASAARQASTAVPGAGAAGFDSGVDSVLASFARMEQVQRQLSKSASNSGKSSSAPSRTASGLMPAAGTPQRVRSGSRRGAAPPGDAGV